MRTRKQKICNTILGLPKILHIKQYLAHKCFMLIKSGT